MTLATTYEFVLPRGYVDDSGVVHRKGVMRLATARDELEPLRDPTVSGPDDPRLTILVLARVVERLGSLELVTPHDIEGLFAADLAFLQDFYGVINFGNQDEYDALMAAQQDAPPMPNPKREAVAVQNEDAQAEATPASSSSGLPGPVESIVERLPRRSAIEEISSASGR